MKRLEYHITVQSDDVVSVRFNNKDELGHDEFELGKLNRVHLPYIKRGVRSLQREGAVSRASLTDLGSDLYKLLFDSELKTHFKLRAWQTVKDGSDAYRLAIALTFQDKVKAEIASLPWEFLYYPDDHLMGTFLATDERVTFSRRRLLSAGRLQPLGAQEPHRVLLLHLQPKGHEVVSLTPIRRIVQGLAQSYPDRLIEPVILKNPTPAEVSETMQTVRPHIVHGLLHGQFSEDGTHFGMVDHGGRQARWYADRSFADLFQIHRPSLLILQACEGGRQSQVTQFAHGAALLVRQQIPAVIAMHHPISNETGWTFAESFYNALIDNQALDVAVQRARLALARMNDQLSNDHATREFGTVAFWMQRGAHSVLCWPEKEHTQEPQEPQQAQAPSSPDSVPSSSSDSPIWLTLTLVAPDGKTRFEADLFSNTLINHVLQNFTEHWLAQDHDESAERSRYSLHLDHPDNPPLQAAYTLEEAAVINNATLYLRRETLTRDSFVSLTIEDQQQERFTTAVLLNTPLTQLVRAFLEFRQERASTAEMNIAIVNNRSDSPSTIELDVQQSLYDAGVDDNTLLRIYPKAGGRS